MAWYDFLTSWRSDAVQVEAPTIKMPALFRNDSFVNQMTGSGGNTDLTRANEVRFNFRDYTGSELIQLYRRDGYHRRYVDIVPNDATRKGWRVIERSSDDSAADEELMEEENKRLCIATKVADAMRWGRLLGAGAILIVNDDENLEDELDVENPGEIHDFIVFDRTEMAPLTWNDDLASGHFREVETWQLTPAQVSSANVIDGPVHRSRLVVFGGARLPPSRKFEEDSFDDSIITAARDQLTNKSVMDTHMARLGADSRIRALKLKGLEGKGLGDMRNVLLQRAKLIAQTINIAGVALLLEGEEFTSQVDNVQGYSTLDDKTRQSVSAVTSIPQTRMFGDAPSGLNTDGASSRNNWVDEIVAVQETQMRKPLEYIYTVLINAKGGVGDWFLEFNPLFEMTESEVADVREKTARTDQVYINTGVLSPDDIARSRFSERGWSPDIKPVDLTEVKLREEMLELQVELENEQTEEEPPEDEPQEDVENRDDAAFLTGDTNGHTHTVEPGATQTGEGGDAGDKHTHEWIKGSNVTGIGGKNTHIHSVPVNAR